MAIPIRKSYTSLDDDGTMHYFIYGLASGVNVDSVNDRMDESAIHAFKSAIDRGKMVEVGPDQFVKSQLPLRSEHQNYWDSDLGWLVEAEIDHEKNLWIKAELDQDNPRSMGLFKKLSKADSPGRPKLLGLSVGGFINKVRHEYDAVLKKTVRVIEAVTLDEISVTSSPANPTTMLAVMRKSLTEFPVDTEESETMGNRIEDKILAEVEQGKLVKSEEGENTDLSAQNENQSESTEETAEVTPSGAEGDSVVEKSLESETPDLQKTLQTLTESVAALTKRVDELSSKSETEEVTPTETLEKSETEEVTPNVEELQKSVGEAIENRLVTAIGAAFESFKKDYVDTLSEKMDLIKTDVERIAAEDVNRAAAINLQKSSTEMSPLERFEKALGESANKRNVNPILLGVQASLNDAVTKMG
jgi:hypothetical protein